ncbi:LemA family protein [Neoroseomonas rubea]|uniref:LemA family protein n=1 Tax=Neoroseomonas rubea TaxID=2748666 RepID=UPI0018E0083D|nr:LemA family protein [Roseomonas rubea]
MEWVILGIIAVLVVWLVVVYNRLVALRQATGQSWSDVDVQLNQRHDLIPNLVETVKGYAAHEKSTLDAVIQARNAAVTAQAQGPAAAGPAEGALGAALGRLFALSEAYPDLKANQNFLGLQSELSDIENKLAAARRFYNASVAEYNAMTESIPAVFFAKSMGFQQRGFFEIPEAERAAVQATPQVRF